MDGLTPGQVDILRKLKIAIADGTQYDSQEPFGARPAAEDEIYPGLHFEVAGGDRTFEKVLERLAAPSRRPDHTRVQNYPRQEPAGSGLRSLLAAPPEDDRSLPRRLFDANSSFFRSLDVSPPLRTDRIIDRRTG